MRLSRSYQPRTLDEVVGQPAVIRRLKRLVALPQPCCLLFEGLGGVGKSAAAKALIADLGVCPFSGLMEYSASNLTSMRFVGCSARRFACGRWRPTRGTSCWSRSWN